MKNLLFVLSCISVSCGTEDKNTDCPYRTGTYQETFTEINGNCGEIPDQIDTVDSQPTATSLGCDGEIKYSDDNCEVILVSVSCPGAVGYTVVQNGKMVWNTDDQGTGTLNISILQDSTGYLMCSSSYHIVAKKL